MTAAEGRWGEPISFRRLLDEAVRQSRRHWRSLYPAVALPMALMQVGLAVFTVYWTRRLDPSTFAPGGDLSEFLSWYGGFWAVLLVSIAVSALAYSAMGAGAVDAVAGRRVAMGRRWLFVFRPGVLLTLFAAGLATGLGMLCCFLPGLALVMLLGLLVPVMAEEGLSLFRAVRRSSELALYNPRRRLGSSPMVKILVLLVVGCLLSFAVSLVVQMPFGVVQQVMLFRQAAGGADPNALLADNPWQWLQVPASLLGSLAQSLVVVYMTVGLALLYFDVRSRREGRDLELALDALEASRGPAAGPLVPPPGGGAG